MAEMAVAVKGGQLVAGGLTLWRKLNKSEAVMCVI
jgi:hypothetical protein